MPEINYEKMLFERAAQMIRVNGIISIVIGGLATFIALLLGLVLVADVAVDGSAATDAFGGVVLFTLFLIPCVYLLIAGILLVRLPKPKVARGLIIANLVLGAFVNTLGLIFAIISLTQIHDYEVGYKHAK